MKHRRGARHGRPGARWRRRVAANRWEVSSRVTRFVEPALLLALDEGPTHGYGLAEQLPELAGINKVDYGNLYRLLRRLEQEEIVRSKWDDEAPGRSKRTYELTTSGRHLLEAWAEALRDTRDDIGSFLERYERRTK